MKFLYVSLILLVSSIATASDVVGRVDLVMHATGFGPGPQMATMSLWQKGDRVLGHTFFGPNTNVNLTVNNGRYLGWAGGYGNTDLVCTSSTCKGTINSNYAEFSTKEKFVEGKGVVKTLEGRINFFNAKAKRSAEEIEVSGYNSMVLDRTSDGKYSGRAYVYTPYGIASYDVRMTTEGTFKNFENDALFAIFLVAPFTQR